MGTWGERAFDNDTAADWFASLQRKTGLRDEVVGVLERGIDEEGHETVRAAAWVMVQLAQAYTWPVETLEADLRLAISSLEEVWHKRLGPLYEFADAIKVIIDAEIEALRSRLPPER